MYYIKIFIIIQVSDLDLTFNLFIYAYLIVSNRLFFSIIYNYSFLYYFISLFLFSI